MTHHNSLHVFLLHVFLAINAYDAIYRISMVSLLNDYCRKLIIHKKAYCVLKCITIRNIYLCATVTPFRMKFYYYIYCFNKSEAHHLNYNYFEQKSVRIFLKWVICFLLTLYLTIEWFFHFYLRELILDANFFQYENLFLFLYTRDGRDAKGCKSL